MVSRSLQEIIENNDADILPTGLSSLFRTESWTETTETDLSGKAVFVRKDAEGNIVARTFNPDDPYDQAILNDQPEEALKIAEGRIELLEKVDTSEMSAEQLQRYNEDLANQYFDKAYALAETGDHQAALDAYEQVLELDPTNAAAMNNAGCALSCMGEFDKAHEYFLQSVQTDPNSVISRLNLAGSFARKGDMSSCIEQLKKAIETPAAFLDPCERHALQQLKDNTGWTSAADVEAAFNPPEEPEAEVSEDLTAD